MPDRWMMCSKAGMSRGLRRRGRSPERAATMGKRKTDTITCATQKNYVPAPAPPNAALNAEVVLRDQIRSEGTRKLRST